MQPLPLRVTRGKSRQFYLPQPTGGSSNQSLCSFAWVLLSSSFKVTQKFNSKLAKKILIVEDNNASREILVLRLRSMGYEAIEAQNSKEALARAEAEKPDLIFMDMGLPEIDGIKTSAMLKHNPQTSHIPIVALTAWISDLWREKASRVGIARYLLKPISPQILKQTIEELTTSALSPNW